MYKIGIDLGGTNIAVGVIDDKFNIVGRGKKKTNVDRPVEEIFDDIAAAIEMAIADAKITKADIESVGIGTPGSVNKELGRIDFANNLNFDKVPARDLLKARTGIEKIYIDNDANCAALGEAIAGAGAGVKDFVAITLGTGVGSGIIIDGKLLVGTNYAAGEIGHTVIKFDGVQCNCGRRGCWEQYASATALIRQTKEAMKDNSNSKMWEMVNGDIEKVSGRTAFDAMRAGDSCGKAVVDQYIKYVAIGITNIINTFQPDIICIGGGISHEGDTLINPILEFIGNERYSVHAGKQTKVCKAVLGNDAGIIGAALLDF